MISRDLQEIRVSFFDHCLLYRSLGTEIIDILLREGVDLPEYPLKHFMQPTDLPQIAPPKAEEQTSMGICVADYILGCLRHSSSELVDWPQDARETKQRVPTTYDQENEGYNQDILPVSC